MLGTRCLRPSYSSVWSAEGSFQRGFSSESQDLMNRILSKYPAPETKRAKSEIISEFSRQKVSLEMVSSPFLAPIP